MKVLIKNRQRLIKINLQKIKCNSRKALRLLGLKKAELSILLVNDKRMRALNCAYRSVDKTTDVLSFPQYSAEARIHPSQCYGEWKRGSSQAKVFQTSELLASGESPRRPNFSPQASRRGDQTSARLLGDVVINLQAAKRQAPEAGLLFHEEIRWLLVHGILHLIGYDHEKSKYAERKMREKEKKLLKYI